MTALSPVQLEVALPDPSKHGYTHGIAAGEFVFIAGQCGTDGDDEVVSLGFAGQARRVLERMEAVVVAAGGTRADIVAMTVFVTDIRNGPEFTRLRREFFGDHHPTSALVAVAALMPPHALVEAQGVAVLRRAG